MNKVFFGDCRDSLRQMASDGVKVQMCVTSPPYFGLRDYGHEGQIGQEETPEQFIASLVEVFAAVRDVLADDGVLWVNMGDSYCSTDKWGGGGNIGKNTVAPDGSVPSWAGRVKRPSIDGCKPKDLIGIPWLLAFALRADGWYLRQDIIWHKPNPMPESVTDRCTKSHEYIFLLSKSPRYLYDAEAVKEAVSGNAHGGSEKPSTLSGGKGANGKTQTGGKESSGLGLGWESPFRNKRSVWTVATTPYSGAHFATFPTALIEPCILAGSRVGDIVLDPFFGSGTSGQVAMALGRQYIGCELNPAYEALQLERTRQPSLLFA